MRFTIRLKAGARSLRAGWSEVADDTIRLHTPEADLTLRRDAGLDADEAIERALAWSDGHESLVPDFLR